MAGPVQWGAWSFVGNFTLIDLLAATTNALNGAILARRPDHYRNFTIVGVLLMALFGGIGGGVTRDVLLNQIPAALTNPAYVALCLVAGAIGYAIAYDKGQLFREGLFQFATSISLPWYAIVGVDAATDAGLPVLGALVIAIIGPTAGRYFIDLTSGVPAKQFIQGEWFVGTAVISAVTWLACAQAGIADVWDGWAAYLIAFAVGFTFRVLAMYRGWEEPLAAEPAGVYRHSDGRPLFGRKLSGKSVRELRALGLLTDQSGEQRR